MSDHSQREIDDAERLRRQERDERFGEMTNEEWEARKRGMAEKKTMKNSCPSCGSSHVKSDFDPDCGKFWTCEECDHQWSYQHENGPPVQKSQADIEFLDWLCGRVPVAPDERREIEEIGKEEG